MTLHARLLAWLTRRVVTQRGPDVVIGGAERPYLLRWYIVPRNRWFNIYLHKFCRSDDDRALHSHPWRWNASWLLSGSYLEVLPADPARPEAATTTALRAEGTLKFRWAESWHRVALFGPADDETPVWTLFLTLLTPPTTGWRACTTTDANYVVNDELVLDGEVIATLESFDDDGPFYAKARTLAGPWKRSGAMTKAPDATRWAEVQSGYSARRKVP